MTKTQVRQHLGFLGFDALDGFKIITSEINRQRHKADCIDNLSVYASRTARAF